MKLLTTILLLLVALSGNAKDTDSPLKIIQPLDNSLYAGVDTTIVVEINPTIVDELEIVLNNGKIIPIKIEKKKHIYCKSINIDVGENNIVVNAYANKELNASIKRNLYFFADVFEGSDEDEAQEYDKNYFHEKAKEEKCKPCHNMTSNVPTDGNAFEDVTQITCYGCHKNKLNKKNTHAPAANWLCLECHNGKVGEYNIDDKGKARYIVRDPVAKTCEGCHDTIQGWFMNKYTHGPVNDGRCIRCHNPHGSNNEFFLRKPVWDLCTTCHAEKANGKHVIPAIGFGKNPTAGGHPTKDRKDPARPGRDFYCSSCHNPHGSSGIFLLRMKGSFTYGVCQRCHKK